MAPKGWLFIGFDFDSLEDKISGLTTKDPNKLKVYLDQFDGHCLRAYSYFKEQMPDIEKKLSRLNDPGKFYKVTHDDGKEEYFHEQDLPEEIKRNLGI